MPQLFKDYYPTTRCIIDATELFIQSPSNPQAQLTFSSYKNHNTLKAPRQRCPHTPSVDAQLLTAQRWV